jgi:hypothetical protein
MKNIICFLTVKPTKDFYDFAKNLKNNEYDVYIIIDSNEYMIPEYDGVIPIIKINNTICEARGFKNTLYYCKNKAFSRDKALYYFTVSKIPFRYLWMIEEDVFIPNTTIISSIDAKYPNFDLLCKANKVTSRITQPIDWHWPKIKSNIFIQLPWACSLVCAIRITPKLLGCIANYAKMFNTLFLDEALFNTIAIHNGLSIRAIDELSKLEFNKIWNINEFSDKYLYHPIKNIQDQIYIRKHLENSSTPITDNSMLIENTSNKTQEIKQLELQLAKAIETKNAIESNIEELNVRLNKLRR